MMNWWKRLVTKIEDAAYFNCLGRVHRLIDDVRDKDLTDYQKSLKLQKATNLLKILPHDTLQPMSDIASIDHPVAAEALRDIIFNMSVYETTQQESIDLKIDSAVTHLGRMVENEDFSVETRKAAVDAIADSAVNVERTWPNALFLLSRAGRNPELETEAIEGIKEVADYWNPHDVILAKAAVSLCNIGTDASVAAIADVLQDHAGIAEAMNDLVNCKVAFEDSVTDREFPAQGMKQVAVKLTCDLLERLDDPHGCKPVRLDTSFNRSNIKRAVLDLANSGLIGQWGTAVIGVIEDRIESNHDRSFTFDTDKRDQVCANLRGFAKGPGS